MGSLLFLTRRPRSPFSDQRDLPFRKGPGRGTQASLDQSLVGSLLLSPGSWCAQGSVCALQAYVSPVRVSSASSVVGLMATSSKRAYAIPRSVAHRAPAPAAGHYRPIPSQETLKHSSVSVSVCLCGASVTPYLSVKRIHLLSLLF